MTTEQPRPTPSPSLALSFVPIQDLRQAFQQLKLDRRLRPEQMLDSVGSFGRDAIRVLAQHAEIHPFAFRGKGMKSYVVAVKPGASTAFSRAINSDLFIFDHSNIIFTNFI